MKKETKGEEVRGLGSIGKGYCKEKSHEKRKGGRVAKGKYNREGGESEGGWVQKKN